MEAQDHQQQQSNAAFDVLVTNLRHGASPSAASPYVASPNSFVSRHSSTNKTAADSNHLQPNIFTPTFSPQPQGMEPRASTDALGSVNPGSASPAETLQSVNLLGLLKRNQSSQSQVGRSSSTTARKIQNEEQASQNRALSASDLVASFMGSSVNPNIIASQTHAGEGKKQLNTSAGPSQTSEYLLNLLSRSKPESERTARESGESQASHEATADSVADLADILSVSPTNSFCNERVRSRTSSRSPVPPLPKQSAPNPPSASIFTYVNPFDDLAASSPRNRTPRGETPTSSARATRGDSATPAKSETKLTTRSIASVPVRTRFNEVFEMSAPSGPSAEQKTPKKETVAEALSDVAAKVDKEVKEAFERVSNASPLPAHVAGDRQSRKKFDDDNGAHSKQAAAELQKQPNKQVDDGSGEPAWYPGLERQVKTLIENLSPAVPNDSWGSDAEDTPSNKDEDRVIRVFNLPMKPFVSITVGNSLEDPQPRFHDDSVMDIAHLKKEFDQVDRALVTSTPQFIAYGMSKSGGIRTIRQDDGLAKQLFKSTHDRIFNVSISSSSLASEAMEAVIGTSVGGSVYWAPLSQGSDRFYEHENPEDHGFVMGTSFPNEESNPGVQLKTRARKSCRHPQYFALGRGKVIYIIFPLVAASPGYQNGGSRRAVNLQKYMADRSFRIHTHKAGKDFTFSEDDSTIASLDKSGRVQIWDIRALVESGNGKLPAKNTAKLPSIDVKTTLSEFMTTAPNEKAWPTSIQFVDKFRPYLKGGALRFLLIGTKQNHTLQLWDLALGQAVQELNFPHDNESDAICSVVYHPYSGFVIIGHPTRNSIYFVHLSAPKYSIPHMSQADYINRLQQQKDGNLLPEATAILSGLREYSFASKGQLRSLDLLAAEPNPKDPAAPLFELYAMHSKGITCITVGRDDLGWDERNKVKNPVDAEAEGLITIGALSAKGDLGEPVQTGSGRKSGTVTPQRRPFAIEPNASSLPLLAKPAPAPNATATATKKPGQEAVKETSRTTPVNGEVGAEVVPEKTEKIDKRRKKKSGPVNGKEKDGISADMAIAKAPVTADSAILTSELPVRPKSYTGSQAEQSLAAALGATKLLAAEDPLLKAPLVSEEPVSVPTAGPIDLYDGQVKQIGEGIAEVFREVLSQELTHLRERLDDDKRISQASGDAKQDAVLRLVSSTLSENVEKSLARMVRSAIQQVVVPSLAASTTASVEKSLSTATNKSIESYLSTELGPVLSTTISRIFSVSSLQSDLADRIANSIEDKLSSDLSKAVKVGTEAQVTKDLSVFTEGIIASNRNIHEQLAVAKRQQEADGMKMEAIMKMQRETSQLLQVMSQNYAQLQSQYEQLHAHAFGTSTSQLSGPVRSASSSRSVVKTPQQAEYDEITQLLMDGKFEEAVVKWLPSGQQQLLFDRLLSHIRPDFLRDLSTPLVTLSVAAAISGDFGKLWKPRIEWLSVILPNFTPAGEPALNDVAPGVLDRIITRLETLFMDASETNPGDPALRKIPALTKIARELRSRYGPR
ncbi:MAG: hypothetical protein M1814_000079 [Vezdaea aestivalis]|nr:MAG: hypothetical protein M1814_000079 [Vezdaea aestivalis]